MSVHNRMFSYFGSMSLPWDNFYDNISSFHKITFIGVIRVISILTHQSHISKVSIFSLTDITSRVPCDAKNGKSWDFVPTGRPLLPSKLEQKTIFLEISTVLALFETRKVFSTLMRNLLKTVKVFSTFMKYRLEIETENSYKFINDSQSTIKCFLCRCSWNVGRRKIKLLPASPNWGWCSALCATQMNARFSKNFSSLSLTFSFLKWIYNSPTLCLRFY